MIPVASSGYHVTVTDKELNFGFWPKWLQKTIDRSVIASVEEVEVPCNNLGFHKDYNPIRKESNALYAIRAGSGVRVTYRKGQWTRRYTFNTKDPQKVIQALRGKP